MNGYRKMMQAEGGNLGWCKPYWSADNSVVLAENDGGLCGALINGADQDLTYGFTYFDRNTGKYVKTDDNRAEILNKIAKLVNEDYDFYSGWDDMHIALDVMREGDCCDCPWFSECDAMNNPDDWEDNTLSADYPDD